MGLYTFIRFSGQDVLYILVEYYIYLFKNRKNVLPYMYNFLVEFAKKLSLYVFYLDNKCTLGMRRY